MAEPRDSSWINEQAAEYADLVGSFVESVHDEDTDEMLEYQLIWEGGDLGVALTPVETDAVGVMVSRVTGKGFPFGIKNVGPGDVLLSINLRDTTKLTLDQVVAFLQECDLPATLRFKKVSPDLDKAPAPPAVPRVSHFVVTSDAPTSPQGSRPSQASTRASRGNARGPPSVGSRQSMQHGRMSVASQPRASDTAQLPPPPPAARQSSGGAAAAAVATAPPPQKPKQRAPAPAPAPALAPVAAPAPVPVPVPVPAQTRSAPPPAPVVAAAAAAAPVVAPPSPVEKRMSKTKHVAPPAPAPPVVPAMERASVDSYGSSQDQERESWKSSEEDIDEARERLADLPAPSATTAAAGGAALLARGESLEGEQPQRQHAQSVAMLGDFSTETNGIPMLPEESTTGMIASVDGIPQAQDFVDSDEDISPLGHAVQPRNSGRARPGSPPAVDNKPDIPRESVRMTMDGGAEPMMKSQPIGTLHELCAKGNLRGVMQHLKVNGPDGLIQREANHGQTCLHLAVKSGNVQVVKHILEQYEPADELINVEDDKGNTALHFAATKTAGMVHMLLESGASANVKNSRKLTPLIISVITSRDDAVIIPRMLLKFGANPNDMHDSQTVIHTAIGSGLLNIAGALVHAGAKMDVEDTEGKSVYEKLDKKSLRFLISHIYFPPTYITEKERSDCMLCHKKFKFGHRKNNCTHCGRLCCSECSGLMIEMYKFPMGFPGRIRKGAAVRDLRKVCKTCYGVFKERGEAPQKENENRFLSRVIGIEWDEVNPNKLEQYKSAGRRGEKNH